MGCGGDDSPTPSGGGGSEPLTPQTEVTTVRADLSLELSTDKALYRPGLTCGVHVVFDVVGEQALTGNSWTWTAPATDFTGYLADIYVRTGDHAETVYATIGIDVSSNWGRYPRYGFVGTYDRSKTNEVIASEVEFLNRCHINGIQFYDWQMKHHWPLGGTRDNQLESYTDIANREVLTSVVKSYIAQHHSRGMKAMFYNLCYGMLEDAAQDGVDERWGLFTNATHSRDKLSMPSGWKGDIYLADAVDYSQAGVVYRYSREGQLVDHFRVGINPSCFAFK